MSKYPDITQSAFEKLEPGTILAYLFRVAEELTLCLDAADEEAEGESSGVASKDLIRAFLFAGARQVLKNGMRLLGAVPISQ